MEVTFVDDKELIRNLANRVAALPALPVIASRLLEAVDDPHTSASEMAELISSDPALATRLLKLANSAFYGFPRRIGTVNLAVVVLGFETVRDLCLSVIIADCFFSAEDEIPLNMEAFWKHSLSVAIASRLIYKMSGANHAGEAFIAGLVHDLGKLFLARYFPDDFNLALKRIENDDLPPLEAEREIFSTTHPIAGAWLLEEWNLPVWLVEATRNHHSFTEDTERKNLVQSVCFADYLVKLMDAKGTPLDNEFERFPKYLASLKIRKDDNDTIDYGYYIEKLEQELSRSEGFMSTIKKDETASN